MFKHLVIYRIAAGWTMPGFHGLEAALQAQAFNPCGPTQEQSAGWVPPRGAAHGALAEYVAGHLVLKLAVERRAVPGPAVRAELEARCKAVEAETGRKPGRKEKAEIKDEIVLSFLPRAFGKRLAHWLWLDAERGILAVDAASLRAAEPVVKMFVDAMAELKQPIPLSPISTAMAPATAMGEWLCTKQPPEGFTIDRTLELKKAGEERSVVRYSRHTLELDEIGQHIQEGKLPTQLAMTWQDKVSFVLTEQLTLKRIELRGVEEAPKGEDGFDADVTIATAEIGALLPDLFAAMGGELGASHHG